MEFFTLAALTALVIKGMSLIKAAKAGDWNTVVSQLGAWALAVGVISLGAHSNAFEAIDLGGGVALGSLDGGSCVLAGMSVGSLASFAYDYKKARDNTDGAMEQPLVGPPMPRAAPPAA